MCDSLSAYAQLLEVDLWEEKQLHALDNSINKTKVEVLEGALKDTEGPLWRRIVTSKELWFAMGLYVGLRASR